MKTEMNAPLSYIDLLQDSPETAALELYLDAVALTIAGLDMVYPQERRASEFLNHLGGRMEFAIEQIIKPLSTASQLHVGQMRKMHRQLLQSIDDYKQRGERGTEYLNAVAIAIADLDEQHPAESRTTEWFLDCIQRRLEQALKETKSWEAIDALNRHPSVVQATLAYQHQRRLQLRQS